MIEGPVLILNRTFLPVQVTSIKRAISLVFKGLAKVVDSEYQLYDFKSWAEVSLSRDDERIQLTRSAIKVPRVILLQFYDKLPRRNVRLTRQNIYLRDKSTCQYCGRNYSRADLNLDHVVPLSQGGRTTWDNVVCSCLPCNHRKGGRTPEQAGIALLSKPAEPAYSIFMHVSPKPQLLDAWRVYMNPLDFAYWCLELKPD